MKPRSTPRRPNHGPAAGPGNRAALIAAAREVYAADGLGAQAVPVFSQEGLAAALGFVFPAHLVTPAKRRTYTHMLHSAARQISTRLGAPVYPFGRESMKGKKA